MSSLDSSAPAFFWVTELVNVAFCWRLNSNRHSTERKRSSAAQPIGQRAPIFHPEVRPFELPPANFPSVTYPPRRTGGPSNSLSLSLALLDSHSKPKARRRLTAWLRLRARRQICRVKSQMNSHSAATEGNQRVLRTG